MSKEAMKLALEALEQIARLTGPRWALENSYAGHLEAITALREALAEQLAQQEPWCMKMNGCKTKCEDCPVEVLPAQQEPVALPCCGYMDASAIKWNPHNQVVQCHNCGRVYLLERST